MVPAVISYDVKDMNMDIAESVMYEPILYHSMYDPFFVTRCGRASLALISHMHDTFLVPTPNNSMRNKAIPDLVIRMLLLVPYHAAF